MIQKLGAQFLARLTGLVGLRAERVAKQEAPVLTGQLRSGIAYRRIGDFRGVVETSHITRSYAGVQERRVGIHAAGRAGRGRFDWRACRPRLA